MRSPEFSTEHSLPNSRPKEARSSTKICKHEFYCMHYQPIGLVKCLQHSFVSVPAHVAHRTARSSRAIAPRTIQLSVSRTAVCSLASEAPDEICAFTAKCYSTEECGRVWAARIDGSAENAGTANGEPNRITEWTICMLMRVASRRRVKQVQESLCLKVCK